MNPAQLKCLTALRGGWKRWGIAMVLAGSLVGGRVSISAEPGRGFYPLNQSTAPGVAGTWAVAASPELASYFQPVSVELPEGGSIGFYPSGSSTAIAVAAPGAARLQVGKVYRLRIADMPQYPGVELYPTVELIDRLHPPTGEKDRFPIPVPFTDEELQSAMAGKLVTKVIYLERPDNATADERPNRAPSEIVTRGDDALAAGYRMGRPMAIVRIGSRQPDPLNLQPGFFGDGAPVEWIGVVDRDVQNADANATSDAAGDAHADSADANAATESNADATEPVTPVAPAGKTNQTSSKNAGATAAGSRAQSSTKQQQNKSNTRQIATRSTSGGIAMQSKPRSR